MSEQGSACCSKNSLICAAVRLIAQPNHCLAGLELPQGRFGALLSGGWIPLLNALVAIKVTLGSWAMIQRLVRHRGLR
jgi:multicomponent Na+:H+ antiporter subunit B